jgi:hypothetical protein
MVPKDALSQQSGFYNPHPSGSRFLHGPNRVSHKLQMDLFGLEKYPALKDEKVTSEPLTAAITHL